MGYRVLNGALLLSQAAWVVLAQVPGPGERLPRSFPLPEGVNLKPGSLRYQPFDAEVFEARGPESQDTQRFTIEGRTWRFRLQASQGRSGALALLDALVPLLEEQGWQWLWVEHGVARRKTAGVDMWLRVQAGASGELKAVMVERGDPPLLPLPRPGLMSVYPSGPEDFPYLLPWPGSRISSSATGKRPLTLVQADGRVTSLEVNSLEKEYLLPDPPPSAHAFLVVYGQALQAAGWEVFKEHPRNDCPRIEARYTQEGRDIRIELRLEESLLRMIVADVGAQGGAP